MYHLQIGQVVISLVALRDNVVDMDCLGIMRHRLIT